MTSEHQKETAFLQHCLGCDDRAEHQALARRITLLQRDERCVGRAEWLMAVLTALAVASLGYAAILFENLPPDTSHLMVKIASTLGLTSIFCLVTFEGLRRFYRLKLNQRREEGRQLVTGLMRSYLGRPPGTTSRREDPCGDGNCETVHVAAGRNRSPDGIEPAASMQNSVSVPRSPPHEDVFTCESSPVETVAVERPHPR